MVKAVSFFRRKAGMPVEEFQAYWRRNHPAPVVPGLEDTQAMRASATTAEYARTRADEPSFLAPGDPPFIITTEHVIVARR